MPHSPGRHTPVAQVNLGAMYRGEGGGHELCEGDRVVPAGAVLPWSHVPQWRGGSQSNEAAAAWP